MLIQEVPILLIFPNISLEWRIYLNYLCGYVLLLGIYQLVAGIFLKETIKAVGRVVYAFVAGFIILLFVLPMSVFPRFTNIYYTVFLVTVLWCIVIAIRAAYRKRVGAKLMLFGLLIVLLCFLNDALYNLGIIIIDTNNLSAYGVYSLLIFIGFIQAKLFSDANSELISSNIKLLEADKLKDKIMKTEMAFLHAQIKPHFLYNALSCHCNRVFKKS